MAKNVIEEKGTNAQFTMDVRIPKRKIRKVEKSSKQEIGRDYVYGPLWEDETKARLRERNNDPRTLEVKVIQEQDKTNEHW